MKILFQADNDLNQKIVSIVLRREPMIDFQTAAQANLHGLDDLTVLSLAALENRLLISHDQRTMPDYFAQFILENESPGVLIAPQTLDINLVVEEIIMVWAASEAEEWQNRIAYLPL